MPAEDDLVQVAWTGDEVEAGLIQGLLEEAGIASSCEHVGINGPQVGFGLLNPGGGSRRVMVHAVRAEEAKTLLAETLVADEHEAPPEPVNAEHLEDARGRRPRNYGLIGAYARAFLWSFLAMAAAFGVFVLLRALGIA
jgi:Putative prokaryotic signal transducing protein